MSKKTDLELEIRARNKDVIDGNVVSLTNNGYLAEVVRADSVIPRQQPWFMDKIIPLGTSTLFAGFGNSGKSQLLIHLAAKTTTGAAFNIAETEYKFVSGGIIILSGEDDFETTLVPRLIAAEADLTKCFLLKMMKAAGRPNALLDLNSHLVLLEKTIIDSPVPIKLIIIDPVQYFTGEMKDHINANVCQFIGALNDLARKYNLALIMNRHLRKKGGGDGASNATDSVSGSAAWTTSPRSCWLIQRHPTKDVIIFADLKGNLRKKATQSPAYTIEETYIKDPADDSRYIQTTRLIWQDKLEDIDADAALNTEKIPPKELEIRQWIINFLLECYKQPNNGGMYSSADLYKQAIEAGHARNTYYTTKAKMTADGIIREGLEGRVQKVNMIILCDPETYNPIPENKKPEIGRE